MNGKRLGSAIARVLETGDPAQKAEAARDCGALLAEFSGDDLDSGDWPVPPDRPARPQRPLLVSPASVRRRRLGSAEGRAALLHALAHIELNAIDLAFDMALRFTCEASEAGLAANAFARDWIGVGVEEAKHFSMLTERLGTYSMRYGDLPAHDGLWEAAQSTADSAIARLGVCHLILEARGLDATPSLAAGLRGQNDPDSAAVVDVILIDEVGHVAAAATWFRRFAGVIGADPASLFRAIATERFRGRLRPPFNRAARDAAGLPPAFYDLETAQAPPDR